MRHARVVMIVVAFATATIARAEVIQLKNGDRLSGSFLRLVGGKIFFKTASLGTLTIPVAKIASLTSQKPVVVILKNGDTPSGIFSLTEAGVWQLQSAAGTTTLQAADVAAIYPAEVYKKQRPKRHHMPWQDWKGQGALGYVLQQSSQYSKSLSVNFTSSRIEPTLPGMAARRATHFSFNMAFATVTQSGVTTKANTLTSVLRQDLFFGGKSSNYIFLQGQWDHIQPQELQLRQTYGGGIGRNLVQRPSFTFAVQGGATYVRTSFETGELRNQMEALAGEKFTLTFLKHLSIDHEFDVYPSLTAAGDYRFNSLTALNAPISNRFSFNISVNDQFLSRPVPGTQQNVLILSTGLGINF
jgi:putative salt-induced outer membrane protein YdiY